MMGFFLYLWARVQVFGVLGKHYDVEGMGLIFVCVLGMHSRVLHRKGSVWEPQLPSSIQTYNFSSSPAHLPTFLSTTSQPLPTYTYTTPHNPHPRSWDHNHPLDHPHKPYHPPDIQTPQIRHTS